MIAAAVGDTYLLSSHLACLAIAYVEFSQGSLASILDRDRLVD